jgi:hypothetical protein
MTTPMNKVDPKLKLPSPYDPVRIFYRQGEGEGWGLAWSIGFWDGSQWNRLEHSPTELSKGTFIGITQRRVEGWSEISHGLSVDDSLELGTTT